MSVRIDSKKALEILNNRWKIITSKKDEEDFIKDEDIREAIGNSINSGKKTYRYVLPTQLLAKVTNPSVDCKCVQKKRGGAGAFDARTLCKKTIVVFDRENDEVLGGSGDPYVNKPLRLEEVSEKYRSEKRNKEGWDDLCFVLSKVEEGDDPDFTDKVFDQTLLEIKRRLETIAVTYPIPRRISLQESVALIEEYLSESSGGDRMEVVTCALFEALNEIFGCYKDVSLSKTTAPNSFMQRAGDIECYNSEANTILAIEAKDRELTKSEVEDSLRKIREKGVSEFFFILNKGVKECDKAEITELIDDEFKSGQNIYITDLTDLSSILLALLGEKGRALFLGNVKGNLEDGGYSYAHRRKWANLLADL